jgi:hypothetical protein
MSERDPVPPGDDDAWLDALRGRPRAGTSPATLAEATAVRDALRAAHAQRTAADQPATAEEQQSLQRLLFRLRREGLIDGKRADAAHARHRRAPMAVAAAVLTLGLVITLVGPGLWQAAEEEPVLRSGSAVQVIESSDVAATVQKLEAALKAAGAAVAVTDLGQGAREVAATVPAERRDAAAAALAPFGIKPPGADGALRIEVRAKP